MISEDPPPNYELFPTETWDTITEDPHKDIILLVFCYPLGLGIFLISEEPPPNFELFPTETWEFFDFFDY